MKAFHYDIAAVRRLVGNSTPEFALEIADNDATGTLTRADRVVALVEKTRTVIARNEQGGVIRDADGKLVTTTETFVVKRTLSYEQAIERIERGYKRRVDDWANFIRKHVPEDPYRACFDTSMARYFADGEKEVFWALGEMNQRSELFLSAASNYNGAVDKLNTFTDFARGLPGECSGTYPFKASEISKLSKFWSY